MGQVLQKALGCIFAIALGYVLKRLGFFQAKEKETIKKITLNITLPAAVITSFAGFQPEAQLYLLILLGLGANLLFLAMGTLLGRNKDKATKVFYMNNCPGYNIGAFTMPFVQNFLGAFGMVVTCLFDMGNSVMCTGGTYALTSAKTGESKTSAKAVAKTMLSSAPFDVYCIMIVVALLGLPLPEALISVTSFVGNANGFLAMLMIGMMFEMQFQPQHLKQTGVVLLIRYAGAALLAMLFYFVLPFSLKIRQVLVLLCFAPIPSISPVFTGRCGGDEGLSSFAASISILISIAIMTMLVVTMGLGTGA